MADKMARKRKLPTTPISRLLAGFSLSVIAGLVVSAILPVGAATTNATYTLSPASAALQLNQQISVDIHLDTAGQPVECVEADLSYDASALQYVSTDVSQSAFNTRLSPTESGGNGSTNLTRCNTGSVSGNVLIASVTFKAITNSSDTSVSFKNTSYATSQGHFLPLDTNGATFTFPQPEPANSPQPTNTTPAPTTTTTTTSKPSSGKSSGPAPKTSTSTPAAAGTSTPTASQPTVTAVATPNTTANKDVVSRLSNKVNQSKFSNFFKQHRRTIIIAGSATAIGFALLYLLFTRLHYKYKETNHFPKLPPLQNLSTASAGAAPNQPVATPPEEKAANQTPSSATPGTVVGPTTAPELKKPDPGPKA